MNIRIRRLSEELAYSSVEYKASRLAEELRPTEPLDPQRLHENALLMTALRQLRIWPEREEATMTP